MDNIIVKVYGLTPDTGYTVSFKNSSQPGAINEAFREVKTDNFGFLSFIVEKHSEKIQIELSDDRIIYLEA